MDKWPVEIESIEVNASEECADAIKLEQADSKTATRLGLALSGVRVDKINADDQLKQGMSGYLLPFVIVSIHLLVVLIGAAYMARSKRVLRRTTEETGENAST